MKQIEVAMIGVHAGATQLDHFAAESFVRREIKFALAIITEIRRRQLTSLQAIGADNFARHDFLYDQVIAKFVEWIDIESGHMRFGQAFAQLEIENLKPQPLGATHFVRASRQSRRVLWTRRPQRLDGSVRFGQYVQS